MTLKQLSAFVLVARLGSVKAAASAMGVSEPAVSQALAALRKYLGDPLLTRSANGMTMTAGGSRLLRIAVQMVSLGAEAETAVRSDECAVEHLRVVAASTIVEFVAGPLADAFVTRTLGAIEVSAGASTTAMMGAMISQRLADVALGPHLGGGPGLVSEPVMRCRLAVLASPDVRLRGSPAHWPRLVEPAAIDPASDVSGLLRMLAIPESRLSVFPHQIAAWEAAASGAGVAPGIIHLAARRRHGRRLRVVEIPGTPLHLCWHATTLAGDRRSAGAARFRHFLGTAEAMRLLRAPDVGVPPSRFRAPLHLAAADRPGSPSGLSPVPVRSPMSSSW
jgi:LysR family transcriptional regulator, low CO2-responsive transcriptional regulator